MNTTVKRSCVPQDSLRVLDAPMWVYLMGFVPLPGSFAATNKGGTHIVRQVYDYQRRLLEKHGEAGLTQFHPECYQFQCMWFHYTYGEPTRGLKVDQNGVLVVPDAWKKTPSDWSIVPLDFWGDNLTEGTVYVSDKKIVVPFGTRVIPKYAFFWCVYHAGDRQLETVVLPPTVQTIGESAFQCRRGLKYINLPEGLQEIGETAFTECDNLRIDTFPTTIQKIGMGAFMGCEKVGSHTFGEELVTVGKYAFDKCGSCEMTFHKNTIVGVFD